MPTKKFKIREVYTIFSCFRLDKRKTLELIKEMEKEGYIERVQRVKISLKENNN